VCDPEKWDTGCYQEARPKNGKCGHRGTTCVTAAMQVSGQRPGGTSGAQNRSLRQSTPVLSRCTAAWTACLTVNAAYSGRPVLRFVLALGGGPGPFVSAGWGRLPGRPSPSRRGCCGGGDRVAVAPRDWKTGTAAGQRRFVRIRVRTLWRTAGSSLRGFSRLCQGLDPGAGHVLLVGW
jgi:hypothetical protein